MGGKRDDAATPLKSMTTVARKSDCELVASRTFDAPARLVFEAWTRADLFKRWWIPASYGMTVLSCEMDVRQGGGYRLEINHPASGQTMAFFGTYLDVVPNARLVWTNEESEGGAVTTVTFEEAEGKTSVTLVERYPTTEACDEALEGSAGALPDQFAQLDDFLRAAAR